VEGDPVTEAEVAAAAEAKVRAVEVLISRLLRAGVVASLTLVIVGTVVTFVHHGDYWSSGHGTLDGLIGSSATFPHTPAQVLAGVGEFRGQAIVALGLLLLIATPVVRVAVSIAAFAYQGDRTFVAITSVVLLLLLLSFALGRAGG
jgi:uncharacterized membrane protein